MKNNIRLRNLIDDNNLLRKTVAKCTYSSKSAVDRWMVPEAVDVGGVLKRNPSYRGMPDGKMELLLIGIEKMKEE